MNMEQIHWVDLDKQKTQEMHFKSLNESNETPTFEYKMGATAKDNLKPQILAITLFDAVMKYRSNIVKEGKATNSTNHGFFNRGEWTEFERHGRMIAQFMGAEDDEISGVLANMKETFSKLDGIFYYHRIFHFQILFLYLKTHIHLKIMNQI